MGNNDMDLDDVAAGHPVAERELAELRDDNEKYRIGLREHMAENKAEIERLCNLIAAMHVASDDNTLTKDQDNCIRSIIDDMSFHHGYTDPLARVKAENDRLRKHNRKGG